VLQFEAGKVDRAVELMREVAGADMENWFPVERCFNWENMVLAEIARGRIEAAESYALRGEEQAAALDLGLPRTLARRGSAALLLAQGDVQGGIRAAEESLAAATEIGAVLEAAYSRSLLGRALAGLEAPLVLTAITVAGGLSPACTPDSEHEGRGGDDGRGRPPAGRRLTNFRSGRSRGREKANRIGGYGQPVLGYVPAGVVLAFGLLAITVCVRQRNPRVPFIAILALIVLVIVAAFGMLAGFGPRVEP